MTERGKQGGVFPAATTEDFTAVWNATREPVQIYGIDVLRNTMDLLRSAQHSLTNPCLKSLIGCNRSQRTDGCAVAYP
jgi:hypothetical protein